MDIQDWIEPSVSNFWRSAMEKSESNCINYDHSVSRSGAFFSINVCSFTKIEVQTWTTTASSHLLIICVNLYALQLTISLENHFLYILCSLIKAWWYAFFFSMMLLSSFKLFYSFIYILMAVLRIIPLMRRSWKMISTRTIDTALGKRVFIFMIKITLSM